MGRGASVAFLSPSIRLLLFRRRREETADATMSGTREEYRADLAAVPLLIVDDLGMSLPRFSGRVDCVAGV